MIIRGNETVLVQGITGKQGTFWSERMRDYGTKIVGGVNPKRAGEAHLELPVWATARDAARETNIDATVMFIPPFGLNLFATHALFGIPLGKLYRDILPFIAVYLIALGLITYVPAITLAPLQLWR